MKKVEDNQNEGNQNQEQQGETVLTTKTQKGHDMIIKFYPFDGETPRISMGGDSRGKYMVIRAQSMPEARETLWDIARQFLLEYEDGLKDVPLARVLNEDYSGNEKSE